MREVKLELGMEQSLMSFGRALVCIGFTTALEAMI